MTSLLEINQLSVKLQSKLILQQLDLNLSAGEILGLVGASGCGKTTLLNAIAGFAKPCAGSIQLDNRLISDSEQFIPAQDRHVGMIFQDYALFPHLSVKQNIAFGISDYSLSEQEARIDSLLALLKLSEHKDKYIHQLSGGQQQRVAIARALAPQPKLLLLDEPFSNIDARLRNELMLEIRQLLKQLNITAIFVTHNKDEVFTFADKMAVMAHGKILQLDSPTAICQQPNSWQVADFLQLGTWLSCELKKNELDTAFGLLTLTDTEYDLVKKKQQSVDGSSQKLVMLIKPQYLEINEDNPANACVEHISVTEQGYHYTLASLSPNDTAKDKVSFYSQQLLTIKEKIALKVNPHPILVYSQ
ncbi:ABC transporter ATP-binding protein [Litorilituus lipolyticus]|uniref:ABC transporter ATP-binding protein n=1 Tax=Litorilituus lipolyticus TaxID=2491017 RepID=A0A502L3D9_9GAMM|nr:ABC transporter ATP-binding protein [Litorilituus lipolyticus]TPH18470.1 ABC transporter ATP-binding protein [Litorilituus lipolyticus]